MLVPFFRAVGLQIADNQRIGINRLDVFPSLSIKPLHRVAVQATPMNHGLYMIHRVFLHFLAGSSKPRMYRLVAWIGVAVDLRLVQSRFNTMRPFQLNEKNGCLPRLEPVVNFGG